MHAILTGDTFDRKMGDLNLAITITIAVQPPLTGQKASKPSSLCKKGQVRQFPFLPAILLALEILPALAILPSILYVWRALALALIGLIGIMQ